MLKRYDAAGPRVKRRFEIIPALDLRRGRVVRLRHGEFSRETIYGDDPVSVARRWVAEGAKRLHVVDLDGARSGRPEQTSIITALVHESAVPVQVAGGLRDAGAIRTTLDAGADRVVLGTILTETPETARALVGEFGSRRLVAALDVRDGQVVGRGWASGAPLRPLRETFRALVDAGVETFAVTAIARDGTLEGPDLALLRTVRRLAPRVDVIASAGIRSIEDLVDVAEAGAVGAIVGTALYEGHLSLRDALGALDALTPS